MTKPSIAIGILALAGALAVRAQAPADNPFIGFWKLNVERSRLSFSPRPNYVSFRLYEDHSEGWMFHTIVSTIDKAAGFTYAAARYDEKEYPVYTSETLGAFLSAGTKPAWTVAFKLVDPHTLEYTDRQNGKITATGTSTVSTDGKTLTETDRTFDSQGKEKSTSVSVFEKQVLEKP